MLVTDKGQLIRCPVEASRVGRPLDPGRDHRAFDTAEDEHVVSVEHIGEEAESSNGKGQWRVANRISCSFARGRPC